MIYRILLCMIFLTFFLGCGNSQIVKTNNSMNTTKNANQIENVPSEKNETSEVWIPTAIEECIDKIDAGEPFNMESSFNPYYLRANLDGNEFADYAVLIKGSKSKKRGVVICKDSKHPYLFGELSNPKSPFTSFENDNFVTDQWEISTSEYTKIKTNVRGQKITPDAKGESVTFLFEGGSGVHIYWDGKSFQVVE